MLSKTQFIRGLQCHKSLWLYRHRYHLRTPPSAALQAVFDRGTDYGILAQQLFPGGIEVPFDGLRFEEQAERTRQLIADGVTTIYEATFLYDDLFVKVDILHRGAAGWEVCEVKSAAKCKEVFVNDIAVQFHAAQGAGLAPVKAALILLDEAGKGRPGATVAELFRQEDVTAAVLEKQPWIVAEIAEQKQLLAGEEPAIAMGTQCHRPYNCDFREYCSAAAGG